MLENMIKDWEDRAALKKKSYQNVLAKLANTDIDNASANTIEALEEFRVAYHAYACFAASARNALNAYGEEMALSMIAAEVAGYLSSNQDRTTQGVLYAVLRDVSYRMTRLTSLRETQK